MQTVQELQIEEVHSGLLPSILDAFTGNNEQHSLHRRLHKNTNQPLYDEVFRTSTSSIRQSLILVPISVRTEGSEENLHRTATEDFLQEMFRWAALGSQNWILVEPPRQSESLWNKANVAGRSMESLIKFRSRPRSSEEEAAEDETLFAELNALASFAV